MISSVKLPASGKIFLAPMSQQPDGATELFINIGLANQGSLKAAEWIPALAPAVSKEKYDDMMRTLSDHVDAHALSPCFIGLSTALTLAYCIGLPCCLYVMCQANQMKDDVKRIAEADGWCECKLQQMQMAPLNWNQTNSIAYDSDGYVCKGTFGGGKHRARYEAPTWPPIGISLVVRVPGTAVRDTWPRVEGNEAQMMGQMMGMMAAMQQGGACAMQPVAQASVVSAAPVMGAMERDTAPPSVTDELVKLANLKAAGVLTEAEFEQAKAKILNTPTVV